MTEPDHLAAASAGLRVFLIPAWENRASNPYTSILADELVRQGWTVVSPTLVQRFLSRADVVHIHWPQKVVGPGAARSALAIALRLGFLAGQKARGAKLVWTTHNIVSHEGVYPRLERLYMRAFVRLLDGVISLSGRDGELAREAFPALRSLPHALVPHSIYGDRYPPARTAVRRSASGAKKTIAFLGDIKPYKGLDALLAALEHGTPDGHRYVIAGKCHDPHLSAACARKIDALRKAGWTIEWKAERLGDQDLVDALSEADLLVLPYRRGENSGLAILAAERGVPLLLSNVPAFRSLHEEIGDTRARIVDGALSHRAIIDALAHFGGGLQGAPAAFERTRSHAATGRQTALFYRRLLAHDGK